MSKKEITYKQAYDELKEIAASLENGTLEIDQLSVKLSRAKELLEICKQKLRSIEEEIEDNDNKSI